MAASDDDISPKTPLKTRAAKKDVATPVDTPGRRRTRRTSALEEAAADTPTRMPTRRSARLSSVEPETQMPTPARITRRRSASIQSNDGAGTPQAVTKAPTEPTILEDETSTPGGGRGRLRGRKVPQVIPSVIEEDKEKESSPSRPMTRSMSQSPNITASPKKTPEPTKMTPRITSPEQKPTPMSISPNSSSIGESTPPSQKKTTPAKPVSEEKSGKRIFSPSWSQPVIRKSEVAIDEFTTEANKSVQIEEKQKTPKGKSPKTFKKTPQKIESSSSEEEEESGDEKEKNEFIEEEVEVAHGYESGDSKDDDEKEADEEENEHIEATGIELGSEDSESDGDEEEDEDNSDVDSFIVEDLQEELLEYSDEDEGCNDDNKDTKTQKRRSRMVVESDTENEEHEEPVVAEKADATEEIVENSKNESAKKARSSLRGNNDAQEVALDKSVTKTPTKDEKITPGNKPNPKITISRKISTGEADISFKPQEVTLFDGNMTVADAAVINGGSSKKTRKSSQGNDTMQEISLENSLTDGNIAEDGNETIINADTQSPKVESTKKRRKSLRESYSQGAPLTPVKETSGTDGESNNDKSVAEENLDVVDVKMDESSSRKSSAPELTESSDDKENIPEVDENDAASESPVAESDSEDDEKVDKEKADKKLKAKIENVNEVGEAHRQSMLGQLTYKKDPANFQSILDKCQAILEAKKQQKSENQKLAKVKKQQKRLLREQEKDIEETESTDQTENTLRKKKKKQKVGRKYNTEIKPEHNGQTVVVRESVKQKMQADEERRKNKRERKKLLREQKRAGNANGDTEKKLPTVEVTVEPKKVVEHAKQIPKKNLTLSAFQVAQQMAQQKLEPLENSNVKKRKAEPTEKQVVKREVKTNDVVVESKPMKKSKASEKVVPELKAEKALKVVEEIVDKPTFVKKSKIAQEALNSKTKTKPLSSTSENQGTFSDQNGKKQKQKNPTSSSEVSSSTLSPPVVQAALKKRKTVKRKRSEQESFVKTGSGKFITSKLTADELQGPTRFKVEVSQPPPSKKRNVEQSGLSDFKFNALYGGKHARITADQAVREHKKQQMLKKGKQSKKF